MNEASGRHQPVLLDQALEFLIRSHSGRIVTILDGTLGAGGHSLAMLNESPEARLVGIDRDPEALTIAGERLPTERVDLKRAEYADFAEELQAIGLAGVDVALFDIGVSSMQLDDGERGFSFREEAPLDMRMAQSGETALELIDRLTEEELANVIYRYGEERLSRRIAKQIKLERKGDVLTTTHDLAEVCRRCYPRKAHRIDPATRTFQALRIAVNDELGQLERMLERIPDWLNVGARLGVISFHSLEDRVVKNTFREWKQQGWSKTLTKKPLTADDEETRTNPRARSAKLRVMECIAKPSRGQTP